MAAGLASRQLKAMLRKNWLLKIRRPLTTCAEILLPTMVMLLLIAVRTRVDTTIHPVQAYIKEGMFVEIGRSVTSPSFDAILQMLVAQGEHLAFAPDNEDTRLMLQVLSMKFPLLKMVGRIYKDEDELETYIRSKEYGIVDRARNLSNPQIRGAIIFHEHGPQLFDYSIRLNHTWAFSGFPDVTTIMDVNGAYLDDLQLGVNIIPTLQYGLSGFLTLQKVVDSFIIFAGQQNIANFLAEQNERFPSNTSAILHNSSHPWSQFSPANIRIVPFPTRSYTDDEFQSIIKKVMGILYLLGFLYPISRLISYTVSEKEEKIREGLYMMGLKDEIFYLSWFITYCFQFAISSAVITISTMNSLFLYSDKSLVFTYFFLFGISAIMLSFIISTFFSRAKTAVAVGSLSFIGAFFPYYTVNDPAVSLLLKVLASLLSPTTFALGTVNFADYERAHVGVRWSNMWQASSGVNFLLCLIMMFIDTILYCAIGLYLDKVLPRENGLCYPWNFLFRKSFWGGKNILDCHKGSTECKFEDGLKTKKHYSSKGFAPAVEAATLDMKQKQLDDQCIQLRDLHKVYMTKKGECCAVNYLNLTLYENQVLALLGHNGAGKSTTISMLIGLLQPTSGDAIIFGKNIRTHMEEIRKGLGVCPQYDILFPDLTVKEHLEIFAILKGVEKDALDVTVTEMVDEVGLLDKIHTAVGALSGGMKRKLSLAIALVGNSKVIILDEPTSGMDPYSMRSTWQLIKKIRKGRIILLTTHSMDEADVLGDRIAIMANGSLRCCGSSLFLKHRFGVGYTLTMVKSTPTSSVAADIVHRHAPSAACLSDVGTEISFRLPLVTSSFEHMFREIESCIRRSVTHFQSDCDHKECLEGIESYGVSVTTLEEVFLKVSGQTFDENEHNCFGTESVDPVPVLTTVTWHNPPLKVANSKNCIASYIKAFGEICLAMGRASCLILSTFFSFLACLIAKFCCCGLITRSTFWRHSKALIVKRALSARRDRRTVIFQLFIPAVFILFGFLFLELKPHPDQKSLILTTSNFNPLLRGGGGGGPIPFNLSLPIAEQVSSHVKGGWIQKEEPRAFRFPDPNITLADAIDVAGPKLGPALVSMSEFLITSLNESYQSRYGAIVLDDQHDDGSLGYTVLHNCSCQHGAPTYINVINAAILRLATGDDSMTIQTRNHPLPMTLSQQLQHHDLDAFSAAIVVAIAFSFIPASYAVPIVKEREVRAKHQQIISGVSILSYWSSTYLWDFISFLFPSSFAIILFFVFDLRQFIGYGCLLPTLFIFLEFGLAVASSTYCITFFFSDHTMAQNIVLLVHFFSGLILMVISFIMGLLENTKTANSFLKNFFRLAPGFCFADGLASLALRRQDLKAQDETGILDWDITGASLCYLGIESVAYFLVTIGIESFPSRKLNIQVAKKWWYGVCRHHHGMPQHMLEPFIDPSDETSVSIADDDMDVQAERDRVLSGGVGDAIIHLRNLRKVYPSRINITEKVAVDSLTFSVQAGECFGLLGTNGAGKTTTLSMLTGEESPSSGTSYIFGSDIRLHPKIVRRRVGYCPQFDPLLEFLTVQEHLELYAQIKEVPEGCIKDVVNKQLVEFDLQKHANKPSFSLSGGNKRKLSVAIAMIGDPPIVILDEPSTGMDPIAKRFMWDVIARLTTRQGKTAVILTTHSMNEAQALCTRIGIMVGGKLTCIGSPQHLKTRFGNHLELEVKATEVSNAELDNLCQKIQDAIFEFPCNTRSIISDLEVCIGKGNIVSPENISGISLSWEMIVFVARMLGNEESAQALASSGSAADGVFGQQLSEQLLRDGGIPLRIFSEWWLAKEKFLEINTFVMSSFPGATFHGCSGLSFKYQLPYGDDSSLADIFGHIEHNRKAVGIEEYSISQSTLETIFNHFAASQCSPMP